MSEVPSTSFRALNYSGLLFNKGNTETPFSTIIANQVKQTQSVEFVTGLEYTTPGGTQPAISEDASLTAPLASTNTRSQKTNVTQIFHESVTDPYAKRSNMGTLSGINIAGQVANPIVEFDYQAAVKMAKIAQDIEATFMIGTYNKATTDAQVNQSRGIMTAIETNYIDLGAKSLTVWDVADLMKLIKDSNGDISNLALWLDATSAFQLNADAQANGLTVVPAARDINGIKLSTILTPLGEVSIYIGKYLAAGTVGLFNPRVISRVEQPTPGLGNFFVEKLAKVGAGDKYQIFGQLGLDHGPEWYHGKIINIATTFTRPQSGKRVYITDPVPTAEVLPLLSSVVLSGNVQVNDETDALVVTYTGTPQAGPTLAYQWQVAATALGTYSNISGATSATVTPLVANVNKFLRCAVTASVYAAGTVYSNPIQIIAAT